MTSKKRIVLFFICAIFFVLSAVIAIFYSEGFRIDVKHKKIVQTGAFYFKVLPKGTEAYIDNKFEKKSDFLFNALFIENILPGTYDIKIKKEGYQLWGKKLTVAEKEVTEGKNIILIKQSPNFYTLSKETQAFFFSPDEKKIILQELNNKNWELSLYDLKTNTKSLLIRSTDINKNGAAFSGLEFSSDSKSILLKTSFKNTPIYSLVPLETNPLQITPLDFLGTGISDISFESKNPQKLIFSKNGVLVEGDIIKKKISPSLLNNIIKIAQSNDILYYLAKDGFLYKTDFSFTPGNKLTENPLIIKKDMRYDLSVVQDTFFVKENGTLYALNSQTNSFEKILDTVKKIITSPNGERIAYFSDSEIWIFFAKEQLGQPPKKLEEKMLLARFSEKIKDIAWLSSDYLIFTIGDAIKVSELDDRDKMNVADIGSFNNAQPYFNKIDKKLYILKEGNFSASEPLF